MNKPTIFLDRDGVINLDKNYVYKIVDFEWVTDAKKAIKLLKEKNYLIFVVTNQSGITRGFYSKKDVEKLHEYINLELKRNDCCIDEFFYSPYHPDIVNKKYSKLGHLRKPNTGMLELAQEKWNFKKNNCLMVGDSQSDMQCAERFGIKGYLFKGGSLLDFIKQII
tara:strand:+ start:3518 stop:4015 length:498 start_codon:yes stop_codon:yes gene_type:complete